MAYTYWDKGKWEIIMAGGNVLNTGQTAVHATLLHDPTATGDSEEQEIPIPNWKVLYFRSDSLAGDGFVKTKLWNKYNQITEQTIEDWPVPGAFKPRLFCSGHAIMSDGKLFVAGGDQRPPEPEPFFGLDYAYTFDNVTDEWHYLGSPGAPKPMGTGGRWYPTVTTLDNGNMLVMSGYKRSGGPVILNRTPQIFNFFTNQWDTFNDTNAQMPSLFDDTYPGAHLVPRGPYEGRVFYSIPMVQSYMFNTNPSIGENYWEPIGQLRNYHRDEGNSILLPIKPPPSNEAIVLVLGGRKYESGLGLHLAMDTSHIIDIGQSSPDYSPPIFMKHARAQCNGVILPDGNVFVNGGNQIFFREAAVTFPEIFDVDSATWREAAPQTYTRMYHSTSILLPDGRVWCAGGDNLGGVPSSDSIEIYSPGYLFDGTRPIIQAISASEVRYDSDFTINTNVPIEKAILISLGSTTHAFDQNQRAAYLTVTPLPPNGVNPYLLNTPANSNILPPGYYMLFVTRAKHLSNSQTNKIPSEAKFIKLVQ